MRQSKPSQCELIHDLLRVARQLAEVSGALAQDSRSELQPPHQQSLDIIEFLPDATFVIDGKGRVIAWNRAMEEMTGLEKREILGKGDYLYAIPFYGERRPILIDLVVGEERHAERAYNFVERNGRELYGEIYAPRLYGGKGAYLWGKASPLYDSNGRLVGAIESIRDITQRKLAEEALRKSEQRFRMLVETMNEGLGVQDEHGVIVYANDQLCEMLGYTKEEILGRREFDFLEHMNGAVVEKEGMGRRLTEKTSCETEMLAKDGQRIPVIISVSPISDERGQYKGTIGTVRDITIRKRAEKKLRESEEKHRMIFENSPLGILHFDQNGTISACNDSIIRIWGSTREHLIGFNLMNSLKNKKMKAAVTACLAGKPGCYEGQYLSVTGGKITNLKADFGPILADDGSCLGGIGILEDLAEWRCSDEAFEEPPK